MRRTTLIPRRSATRGPRGRASRTAGAISACVRSKLCRRGKRICCCGSNRVIAGGVMRFRTRSNAAFTRCFSCSKAVLGGTCRCCIGKCSSGSGCFTKRVQISNGNCLYAK